MAFTNFIPQFTAEVAQDGTSFRIWDRSTWSNESNACIEADLFIAYYASDGTLINALSAYKLIDGMDRMRFDEFLSTDGHLINVADVFPAETRFPDGYYRILGIFSDGSYAPELKPRFLLHRAFLSRLRCMSRKMPLEAVNWPDYDRKKILDAYAVNVLLKSAEDAAGQGFFVQFEKIVRTLNRIYDQYAISQCF
jgi:hypothetical protein